MMKKTENSIFCVLSIFVIISICFFSSCSKDEGLLHDMFDIEARAKKNAPPSTIDELREAINKYSDKINEMSQAMDKEAMYWNLLATKYLQKGLYGDAYKAALKALEHYPQSSGLYYIIGTSCAYLSKTALVEEPVSVAKQQEWLLIAENAYKNAIGFEPNNTKAMYGLAILYSFEMARYEDAIPLLESYVKINKSDVDGFMVYARTLYAVGKLQEAIDMYDKVSTMTKVEEKRQAALENKKRILDELYAK